MRKLVVVLGALAAFGFLVPVTSSPANAATLVIKHRDHGRDFDRRHRDRDFLRHRDRDHDRKKVVIIKKGDRHHGDND